MQAIMISIKSKFVEKILNGEKTIEIRKTMPKCELPCKVYIYCTKQKTNRRKNLFVNEKNVRKKYGITSYWSSDDEIEIINENMIYLSNEFKTYKANGKVVAEFTLDKVDIQPYTDISYPTPCYDGDESCCDCGMGYWITNNDCKKACVSYKDIEKYGNEKTLYFWNITNLKIYDKPKELSEFSKHGFESLYGSSVCGNSNCPFYLDSNTYDLPPECLRKEQCQIIKPPQSWCYVEEEI